MILIYSKLGLKVRNLPTKSILGVLPFNVQQQPLTIYSTRTWQLQQPLTNGAIHVQPLIEELPSLPINRHSKRESKGREHECNREEERKRSCCHMQQSVWAGSWVDVILLHVFIVILSLSLNTMDLSRGCRRFCRTTLNIVSVCLPSIEQRSVHHRSDSPTIYKHHSIGEPPRRHLEVSFSIGRIKRREGSNESSCIGIWVPKVKDSWELTTFQSTYRVQDGK